MKVRTSCRPSVWHTLLSSTYCVVVVDYSADPAVEGHDVCQCQSQLTTPTKNHRSPQRPLDLWKVLARRNTVHRLSNNSVIAFARSAFLFSDGSKKHFPRFTLSPYFCGVTLLHLLPLCPMNLIIIDHFSGTGTAIGPVCVSPNNNF